MSGAGAGELLVVGFEGRQAPDDLLARAAAGRLAGVILFARNIGPPVEVAALVRSIAGAAPPGPPLIISVDQEGGRVQRLRDPLTVWPPMARLASRGDPGLTEQVGRALGEELALIGFNVDFAPVLDVHTNPANPVIGDRSFGSTPQVATEHALAFLRGLEAAGVCGCAKHFPGHGDTAIDSHLALPRVEHALERLRAVELPPFAEAVRAGARMIMTAHVVVTALDELPATMSASWIDGVLRGELGYEGVVVSDDLDMKAVAEGFSVEEVIGGALEAGVDLFLACRDPERQRRAEEALERAAADSRLGVKVARARRRVMALRRTLRAPREGAIDELGRALPNAAHRALASRVDVAD